MRCHSPKRVCTAGWFGPHDLNFWPAIGKVAAKYKQKVEDIAANTATRDAPVLPGILAYHKDLQQRLAKGDPPKGMWNVSAGEKPLGDGSGLSPVAAFPNGQ